jgi:AspT/YidE/YbjL antiporter-like protein
MGWLFELHNTQPIAHAVGVLTFVCVLGMALGSVKFRGIGLGTSGVLFAGILVGHFGEAVDHQTLDFVKEFGLILFVFTIGLQLGPGFFALPGMPQPIRLGLAGGPLIVALILGRVGRIGRQVWHMPVNTNLAFREFGIALFFAAVGLGAGAKFFATVFSATGLQWLLAGACVTVLPLMLIGIFARAVLKMNFMDLSGLLAGSITDPPALAFASNIAGSDAPTIAYATVYPLTTLLRILSAQVLAIVLFR